MVVINAEKGNAPCHALPICRANAAATFRFFGFGFGVVFSVFTLTTTVKQRGNKLRGKGALQQAPNENTATAFCTHVGALGGAGEPARMLVLALALVLLSSLFSLLSSLFSLLSLSLSLLHLAHSS